jgi:hypothetical protein
MVNVHHTRDVSVTGCRFGRNREEGDAVHVAYVPGFELTDTAILNVPRDALDIEFSEVQLRRLRIVGAGDDALDLMGSKVSLVDSMIVSAKGNGISAGEETTASVQNTLIAESKVGVLAKNASELSLSSSVLFRNRTGVRTYQRTVRYAGESKVTANVLFVAESGKRPVKRDDRDRNRLDRGRVLLDLPQPGVLDHVLHNVLELPSWEHLPVWVNDLSEREVL